MAEKNTSNKSTKVVEESSVLRVVNTMDIYLVTNKTKYPIFIDFSDSGDDNKTVGLQPRVPIVMEISKKRVSELKAQYLNKVIFTLK